MKDLRSKDTKRWNLDGFKENTELTQGGGITYQIIGSKFIGPLLVAEDNVCYLAFEISMSLLFVSNKQHNM